MDKVPLGKTSIEISRLGLGAWSWGDKSFWGYGQGYGEKDIDDAYAASVTAGINWIDTAEIYARGVSEKITGRLTAGTNILIATKYFPRPIGGVSALSAALDASLARLGRGSVDLYQIHFPMPTASLDGLMARLAAAVHAGKTKAVGVSNYSAKLMRRAHASLARHGVPLASNQVEYSLLNRKPESNGVLEACRELGVTLIAYSPIAKGALSGKYDAKTRPGGFRRFAPPFRGSGLVKAAPVIEALRRIAGAHQRTATEVALRWLMRQERVVPIPGAKTAQQAMQNAGALGFDLPASDWDELERLSRPWLR